MATKCKECGWQLYKESPLPEFHDDKMGIAIVVKNAIQQKVCTNCGAVLGHTIPNLDGLVAAVAITRIKMPDSLVGSELRFLRKALGWKAKELAEKLRMTPETVSRWENSPHPIDGKVEPLVRLYVFNLLKHRAPKIPCTAQEIVDLKVRPFRPVQLPPLQFYLIKEKPKEKQTAETVEEYAAVLKAAA